MTRRLEVAILAAAAMAVVVSGFDDAVLRKTRADTAANEFGATGKGVTVVVMDGGIDWRHPDFIRPDGKTRIIAILDMTGQNGCGAGPKPVEYSADDINRALAGSRRV